MIFKHKHHLILSTSYNNTNAHKFFECTTCLRVFLIRIVNNKWSRIADF